MAKTRAAKVAKGMRLQKRIRDLLLAAFPQLTDDDIRSTSSGSGGEDILPSAAARALFPYKVEAKNQERVNVWESYKQACDHAGEHEPLLIIARNRTEPLAIVDLEYFVELHKENKRDENNTVD